MCVCLTRGALAVQFVRRAHFRFELFLDATNINEKIKEAVVLDSHTKRSCGGACGTGLGK